MDRKHECKTGANTGLAKVAVQCSTDTFVVNQSLVLRIKIFFKKKQNLIQDVRLIPALGGGNIEEQTISALQGLGFILICLLSKNPDLPNKWNPVGHQVAWLDLAKTKLKNIPISSYTRDIIGSCFSKRNIEDIYIKKITEKFDFEFADDSYNNPPQFIYIDDFIKYVSFCQKRLETQQISISNYQSRQLIPIKLKQLTKVEYQELLQEEE